MNRETLDQYARHEQKRMAFGRKIGALPPLSAAAKRAEDMKAAQDAAKLGVKPKIAPSNDDVIAQEYLVDTKVGQAAADALTNAITSMGALDDTDPGRQPVDINYEAQLIAQQVKEESESYSTNHRGGAHIGHWIEEPIVLASEGTVVPLDNQLENGVWTAAGWVPFHRWRWGNDVINDMLQSCASLLVTIYTNTSLKHHGVVSMSLSLSLSLSLSFFASNNQTVSYCAS
jgi:hypothetical protein